MAFNYKLFIPGAIMLGLGLWGVVPIGEIANGVVAGLGAAAILGSILKMIKLG